MRSLVVTGVSTGIGLEILKLAVENGVHVFGSVRKPEDAARLTTEFGKDHVTPLVFDVRDEKQVAKAASVVRKRLDGGTLFGLVNNAGAGLIGPLLHQPLEEIRTVIDTNIIGTLVVTRAFAPLLGADRTLQGPKGRIVNMSSLAGKFPQPFAVAYVASKHAIEGISGVMRIELSLYGIEISVVGPASVATPIWDHAEKALGKYSGTDYGKAFDRGVGNIVKSSRESGLKPRKVAETVWHALTASRPRLRYSPASNPIREQYLPRMLPERFTNGMFAKGLGLLPDRLKPAKKKGATRKK